jgi:hypothetical protein
MSATIGNFFHEAVAAVEKGASSVYHKILTVEGDFTAWEAANPAVKPLVDEAITYAKGMLARFGVPTGVISIVADDVLASLKQMAATDATVSSVPGVIAAVQPVVAAAEAVATAVAPAAAAPVEAVVSEAEKVAEAAAPVLEAVEALAPKPAASSAPEAPAAS